MFSLSCDCVRKRCKSNDSMMSASNDSMMSASNDSMMSASNSLIPVAFQKKNTFIVQRTNIKVKETCLFLNHETMFIFL